MTDRATRLSRRAIALAAVSLGAMAAAGTAGAQAPTRPQPRASMGEPMDFSFDLSVRRPGAVPPAGVAPQGARQGPQAQRGPGEGRATRRGPAGALDPAGR